MDLLLRSPNLGPTVLRRGPLVQMRTLRLWRFCQDPGPPLGAAALSVQTRPETRLGPSCSWAEGQPWPQVHVSPTRAASLCRSFEGTSSGRVRGSRHPRGREMGLRESWAGDPGRGSERGHRFLLATPHSPVLCERGRRLGSDSISPPGRKAWEGAGPLRLEPWEAQWPLQGGGDSWPIHMEQREGWLLRPRLRCGHRAARPPGAHGHWDQFLGSPWEPPLSWRGLFLPSSCPGASPGQVGSTRMASWGLWRDLRFLFYPTGLKMTIQPSFRGMEATGVKHHCPFF